MSLPNRCKNGRFVKAGKKKCFANLKGQQSVSVSASNVSKTSPSREGLTDGVEEESG